MSDATHSRSDTERLVFSKTFTADQDDLSLFELPPEVVAEIEMNQASIVGEADEDLVLVTSGKTYLLRKAETTNTLLLIAPDADAALPTCAATSAHGPAAGAAAASSASSGSDAATALPREEDSMMSAPGDGGNDPVRRRPRRIVCASVDHHFELVEIPPRVGKLRALLLENPYRGEASGATGIGAGAGAAAAPVDDAGTAAMDMQARDGAIDATAAGSAGSRGASMKRSAASVGASAAKRVASAAARSAAPQPSLGLYTMDDLLEHVQASPQQLRDELNKLNAFELDGYWRVLDRDYETQLGDLIFLTILANGWRSDAIPERALLRDLAEHPEHAVRQVMRLFGKRVTPTSDDGAEEPVWRLDATAVCRWRALELLRAGEAYWQEETFMEQWRDHCPPDIEPQLHMLRGLAITEVHGPERRIRFVDRDALPPTVQGRLRALFALRPRYKADELIPWVADLAGPGQSAEHLIRKYTRALDGGEYALK